MNSSLFLLCPTDFLEPIIETKYKGANYFYASLGNVLTFDLSTLENIKNLLNKKDIRKIYFVLADDNKIFLDALEEQNLSQIRGLKEFNKVIKNQEKQSELLWYASDSKHLIFSYYLNHKIKELEFNLRNALNHSPTIKGKIYTKSLDTFVDIYPNLVCLKRFNLN